MKTVYPIIITHTGKWFVVDVPDLQIGTQGKTLREAFAMANDAISLWGVTTQDDGNPIPEPYIAKQELENGQILGAVEVDFDSYRRSLQNRLIKKTVNIPEYVDEIGRKKGVNFSQVLTDAILAK